MCRSRGEFVSTYLTGRRSLLTRRGRLPHWPRRRARAPNQPLRRPDAHVLDTVSGKPAAGVQVDFAVLDGGSYRPIKTVHTNADGRNDQPLLTGDTMRTGRYQLVFHRRPSISPNLDVTLPDPPFLDESNACNSGSPMPPSTITCRCLPRPGAIRLIAGADGERDKSAVLPVPQQPEELRCHEHETQDPARDGTHSRRARLGTRLAAEPDWNAINGMSRAAFVEKFGGVFEKSPWVAEKAWDARPFSSVDDLHTKMVTVVKYANIDQQLSAFCAPIPTSR